MQTLNTRINYARTKGTYDSKIKATKALENWQKKHKKIELGPSLKETGPKELFQFLYEGGIVRLGNWKDTSTRFTESNMTDRNIIAIDIDDGRDLAETLKGLPLEPNFYMTSASYTEEFHKFKLFYLLGKPLNKREYSIFAKHFIEEILNLKGVDPASYVYNQAMFGACSKLKIGEYLHEGIVEIKDTFLNELVDQKEYRGSKSTGEEVTGKDSEIISRIFALGKPSYEDAKQIVIALGQQNMIEVFNTVIPEDKHHEYIGLFDRANSGEYAGINRRIYSMLFGPEERKDLQHTSTKKQHFQLDDNKYLSDDVNIINSMLNDGWWTLAEAPMGTGKTTLILNHFKPNGTDFKIISVPRNNLKGELYKTALQGNFKVKLIGGKKNPSFKNIQLEKDVLYICSYEALLYLEDILKPCDESRGMFNIIIDEVHTFITEQRFRTKLLDLFSLLKNNISIKRVLSITATPQDLPKFWDTHIKINTASRIKASITLLTPKEDKKTITDKEVVVLIKKLLKRAKEEGKRFIFITDKDTSVVTENFTNEELPLYTSKNQSEIADSLANNRLPHKYFACTDIIGAGNNFYDEESIIILMRPNILYSTKIEQQSGRFREAKSIEGFVIVPNNREFYKFKDSKDYIKGVIGDINTPAKRTKVFMDILNSDYLPCIDWVGSEWILREDIFHIYIQSKNTWKNRKEIVMRDLIERNGWIVKEEEVTELLKDVDDTGKTLSFKRTLRKLIKEDLKEDFYIYVEIRRNNRDYKEFLDDKPKLKEAVEELEAKHNRGLRNFIQEVKAFEGTTEKFLDVSFIDKKKYKPNIDLTNREVEKMLSIFLSDIGLYEDNRRLTNFQRDCIDVLGRVFTYGNRENNTKIAKTLLGTCGMVAKKPTKSQLEELEVHEDSYLIQLKVDKEELKYRNKAIKKEHKEKLKLIKKAGKFKKLSDIPLDLIPKLTLLDGRDLLNEKLSSLRSVEVHQIPQEVEEVIKSKFTQYKLF